LEIAYRNDRRRGLQNIIRVYSLFKCERLSINVKLTLHKALIRSGMNYDSPAWEFAADTHLMKLQCLNYKVHRTVGYYPRHTPVAIWTWLLKFLSYMIT
jgi:hypothetical protein